MLLGETLGKDLTSKTTIDWTILGIKEQNKNRVSTCVGLNKLIMQEFGIFFPLNLTAVL